MDIRPRTLDDLPSCVAALRGVHETDGYPAAWPADPAGWLNPAKLIDARIAEAGHAVVGHVGIGESALPPAIRAVVRGNAAPISVVRLFVVPSSRRCGTGRDLLDAAVEMAKSRGRRAVVARSSMWMTAPPPLSRCTNGRVGSECTAVRGVGRDPTLERRSCITT
ncbi:GNAT family N-acetyltransferase [Nocardia testacea]|uniref:GNAT family N-acetyltransferase n=1 Tax=Nocardia testacea TaxID=248551 RepID=UPI003C30DAF3